MKAPRKNCPKCGTKMDATLHPMLEADAYTHDGWKHILTTQYWMYHCSKCQELIGEIVPSTFTFILS